MKSGFLAYCSGGHRKCERIGIERHSRLLASPQGVAERSRKCCEASADCEAGVVFRWKQKENHPGCVRFGGFAKFFDDAATPPCGDARRGLMSLDSNSFTPS